jgi:uridine kinase
MKLCILISGYLRTIKSNIESLKNNVIQQYEHDIYIHITKNEKTQDKYNNEEISLDFIKKELNPVVIILENNENYSFQSNLINKWKKYYTLFKIAKSLEKKYDVVIKVRPDTYFYEKIEYHNMEDNLYVPKDTKSDNNNNKELCDIFMYGKPKIMESLFNFYLYLLELKFTKNSSEKILLDYVRKEKIPFEKKDINYSVILSFCNSISISGDSGSGKTYLANKLYKKFNNSFILECDRYHKWERGNDNWKKITHLNPDANYLAKMEKDVFDLKIGNNIYQIDYNHETGKFTDKKIIESKENIIICGLHTIYDKFTNHINIYMDTSEELKTKWKIKRDSEKRGYSIEKILENIRKRKADFEKYILPQKKIANIIVKYYIKNENIKGKIGIKKDFYDILKISKNKFTIIENNFIWSKEKNNIGEIVDILLKILT